MLNIVLFGPGGAGKGTQSENIIREYGLVHLSTGNLLRAEIAASTALGLEAKKLMDQGLLVPDAVVIGMIQNKLVENAAARGFIFDGFPRTVAQAEALDKMLTQHGLAIDLMISLEVPQDELVRRLIIRAKQEGRIDDTPEIIHKRIAEYNSKTLPVADYYRNQHKLANVNGLGTLQEVFARIKAQLDRTKQTAH